MRLLQKNIVFLSLVLGFFLIANPLSAQKFGKISGQVTDAETGDVLPGANVLISGTSLGAATNLNGEYTILRVPPGVYSLRVQYIGYQATQMTNLQILTDLTTKADFKLQTEVLASGEEVVIVAERPIIRKDLTSHESRVQAEELERIPAQELSDVLNLQAGVTRDQDGGIHIRGGRSTEVAYMVNGVRITDDFNRSQSIDVANESVQELQVVSGTFNAEYGEALSGVINIVTKTGGEKFSGSFSTWAGDYFSGDDNIFYNIDDIDVFANNNFQATLSGPIFKDKVSFFVTGRRFKTDGYLYGINAYSPQGLIDSLGSLVAVTADSSATAMNHSEKLSGQASLQWKISDAFNFKVDFLGSKEERFDYDHSYRLNPFGDKGDDVFGYATIANLTHILSASTFYELTGAFKYNEIKSNLYDDPFDSRYVHESLQSWGQNRFNRSGTDLSRYEQNTESIIAKFDLTSQISKRHQVKLGLDFKEDQLFLDDYTLIPKTIDGQEVEPFEPDFPLDEVRSKFDRSPVTFAAYVQDKIEYENLIINVGLRYDRFDARGRVPVDKTDPNINSPIKLDNVYNDLNDDGIISDTEQTDGNKKTTAERESYWWQDTSVKTQFSPRLGIAYPITDKGVIHFSYGVFRQTPDFEQLYRRDEILINQSGQNQGPFGNPDLEPQRTTMYELGLQQQLSDEIGADVTLYYRDIRDWISVGPPLQTALAGVGYSTRINRDFAEVKGITLALSRRFANSFSFDFDYTFQIATGTNSSPDAEYQAYQDGNQPTRQLTPLDWDQHHTFNGHIFVGGTSWGAGMSQRLNSGQPYTPVEVTARATGVVAGLESNSRRKPLTYEVDLNIYKNVALGSYNVRLFADVFNLFDRRNQVNVFGDSGVADFTVNQLSLAGYDTGWYIQPYRYSAPRRVQVGAAFNF
ncbi:MAG: TonB-dependent receptor [Calditrichaeota bacterium]|nr:MAG: TonB-dependent receptor [Calditrichota bacterium]